MFTELQLSPELRLKLAGAELTGAAIDQGEMWIRLQMTVKSRLSEEDSEGIKDALQAVYGFSKVEMDVGKACFYKRSGFEDDQRRCGGQGLFFRVPGNEAARYVAAQL